MFARVTKYQIRPEAVEAAKAKALQLKPQVMALPGLMQFINVMNEDGAGYIISIVESEEISNANQEKVQAIWGAMADFLAAPPVPEGYDVFMNENND